MVRVGLARIGRSRWERPQAICVFNVSASRIDLLVNTGQVRPPAPLSPADGYRPHSTSVEIEKFAGPSVFGLGENQVNVRFVDFAPPLPMRGDFPLDVPSGSVRTDYVLYIFADRAVLMRTSGEIVEQQEWPSGSATAG